MHMGKPQNEPRSAVKAGQCFQAVAIKFNMPSKSQAMRLHGAGLLSNNALTELFATRPDWRHE